MSRPTDIANLSLKQPHSYLDYSMVYVVKEVQLKYGWRLKFRKGECETPSQIHISSQVVSIRLDAIAASTTHQRHMDIGTWW